MNAIERRLQRLEDRMSKPGGELSELTDDEVCLAHEMVCRAILERPDHPERQDAEAQLAEIEARHAVLRTNLGTHDKPAEWMKPACHCDALPYGHKPHRTPEQIAAFIAAWSARHEVAA